MKFSMVVLVISQAGFTSYDSFESQSSLDADGIFVRHHFVNPFQDWLWHDLSQICQLAKKELKK